MGTSSLVRRIRRPEYTGENRCLACTIVNLVLVTIVGVVGTVATSLSIGAALLVVGVAAIYVRGYAIPGTPVLTQYLPDRVLSYFDHHETPTPDSGDEPREAPDPETTLHRAGAIEECPHADDLCLTRDFRSEWTDAMTSIRANESLEALITTFLGNDVSLAENGDELYAHVDGRVVGRWPSRTAAVADVAADRVLNARLSNWRTIDPSQRSVVMRGLRPFLDQCPDCGNHVAAEKVTSCCITGQARTVSHCSACETILFKSEPYTDLPEPGA